MGGVFGGLFVPGSVLVPPCLADGGEDLACDPFAEALGLWFPAREDEGIKPRLSHRKHFTRSGCRTNTGRTSFIALELVHGFAGVADIENVADVLGDEPCLVVLEDGSNGALVEGKFDWDVLRVCGRGGHILE